MNLTEKYKPIIGLEIHAQLNTKTKAYSPDENIYGASPNTKTSVISLGHPGTLPKVNEKVIEYAVKLGLAVESKITEKNEYARKNYFYADLSKGCQITRIKLQFVRVGHVSLINESGQTKKNQYNKNSYGRRCGKSMHDIDPFNTLIDLNRAGVPRRGVSGAEINSADEAYQYVNEVHRVLRYLEICDGNMEEGSLRCDVIFL